MSKREFKVGDKVARVSGWGGTFVDFRTVRKVYKNGRFVLEGETQQYRQDGYMAGTNSSYRGVPLRHADEPIVLRGVRRHAVESLTAALGQLRGGRHWDVSEDFAAECRALKERMTLEVPNDE